MFKAVVLAALAALAGFDSALAFVAPVTSSFAGSAVTSRVRGHTVGGKSRQLCMQATPRLCKQAPLSFMGNKLALLVDHRHLCDSCGGVFFRKEELCACMMQRHQRKLSTS